MNELYVDLEVLIKDFSETLIAELALRDELEYEKELKNQFISLVLSVQNKRRQFNTDKRRHSKAKINTVTNDPKVSFRVRDATQKIRLHLVFFHFDQ